MTPDEIDSLRAENVAMRDLLRKAYHKELTDVELTVFIMNSVQRYAGYTILETRTLHKLQHDSTLLASVLRELSTVNKLCLDAKSKSTEAAT